MWGLSLNIVPWKETHSIRVCVMRYKQFLYQVWCSTCLYGQVQYKATFFYTPI